MNLKHDAHFLRLPSEGSPPEERPLVAVILLLLDLMVISFNECLYGNIGYAQLPKFCDSVILKS